MDFYPENCLISSFCLIFTEYSLVFYEEYLIFSITRAGLLNNVRAGQVEFETMR